MQRNPQEAERCTSSDEFTNEKRTRPRCRETLSSVARDKWEMVISGVKYTALTEYISGDKRILVRCNVCDKEFWTYPRKIYSGSRGCPRCAKNDTRTAAENFYRKLFRNNIQPIDEYVNRSTPLRVKHITCNEVYRIVPKQYMYDKFHSARCPRCRHQVNLLLNEHFEGKISSFDLIDIVKQNGWETRMEELKNELRRRSYRNAY